METTYKLLDGKKISGEIKQEIAAVVNELLEKGGRRPHLAGVLVGHDGGSETYMASKVKACEEVGFTSSLIRYEDDVTEEELLACVHRLNQDPTIDGFIVQLPLPKHIDEQKIIEAVDPRKDVDGFHTTNIGKMMIGDETGFLPCTPFGVIQMFEEYGIELPGKDIVVIGQSNIVGKPMSLLLMQKHATVQTCNSRTKNLSEKLQKADIIIAAAGSPKLVKGSDVKDGVAVIDIGINRVDGKICGDVDFDEVSKKASFITPVPGGVGPMTIAMLIKNTLKSYKQKINKSK